MFDIAFMKYITYFIRLNRYNPHKNSPQVTKIHFMAIQRTMKKPILTLSMMTVLAWLTGCASPSPEVHAIRAVERFEGTLPCPDCRGITTELVISRDPITGASESFYMHEIRVDAPGGQRVNTSWGQWRIEHDLIDDNTRCYRLIPEIGDEQLMLIRSDGALQPMNNEGQAITDDEGKEALLKPVTPDLSISTTSSS
ncbi:copper resistance protein NlpE N-terminal domain-containing protein [Larsenimonas rhizosphaerae]|uniref:Copper resistance protein NlpE N-terminal domain-containing protein n=1 Tax=Larsenimonas rhizosphaerae TaxID=2944682 RepID=A0AA41ZG17_9GAMM|nr:copper resistance protein NlpE N-terminal domain-containing protein [Larsenimonas rhizosphaerae]MCM2130795.1 copper resistance protein NlpE [Larsenimonas rhizosphaerae]MCX2523499.1 copper resistance protein NlpE N-terminal domain-containing protein [Larsenimonas rhizosphaerae]